MHHIYILSPQHATDQMISMFNSFVPDSPNFVTVVDLKDPSKLLAVAAVSVRSSVSRLASAVNNVDIGVTHFTKDVHHALRDTEIVRELPLWSLVPEYTAAIYSLSRNDNMEQFIALCVQDTKNPADSLCRVKVDIQPTENDEESAKRCELYRVKIAAQPFAEGSSRTSHHAMTFHPSLSKWIPMVCTYISN